MHASRKARHERVISINAKIVRNINRALILNTIRERQPIPRAKIAEITNLNKSTVSSIVASLIQEELLTEEAQRGRTIGRTPINLRLRSGRHLVGAIAFDPAATRLAVVDIDGAIKHTMELPTEPGQPEAFITRCFRELLALRKRHHIPPLRGIGITVAGIVDPAQCKVVFAPNLGWEDIDLLALAHSCCPEIELITCANDAKASALAELWFGTHDINLSNFVFLSVGRGIGTGIVIDKRVITGEAHAAGEFGHMTLIEGGEACMCGNRGCWETYASDRATVRRYLITRGLDPAQASLRMLDDIIESAKQNEPLALETLRQTGEYLGLGISTIIKAVDPDAIVVGGRVTQVWDTIYPAIMSVVSQRIFPRTQRRTAILPTSLQERPTMLGGAALAIRQFFTGFRVTL